ncbi:CopG family ribbon-helix-helix protein [Devosia naphthalenivorans]|uniref:CopG family ribbon-helix-helix protein n=1 Tax=Devosia naphthalenivorans TaxID=2082392 RepID=UPI000D389288|nr:CopG family transcriptional regulator [Devosia naphthalenivorans]
MSSKIELSDPVALRIPVDVLADIEKIASAADRTRSWVMVRAMKLYLAGEGAKILKVAEGLGQLDNGESEDMDDVISDIEEIVRGNAAS